MGVLHDIAKRGKLIVFIGTTLQSFSAVANVYNLPDFLLMALKLQCYGNII